MRHETETLRPVIECLSAVLVAIVIVVGVVLAAAYGPTLDKQAANFIYQTFKITKPKSL
jgi:hypothetical protein